jgi:VWFA-related protein
VAIYTIDAGGLAWGSGHIDMMELFSNSTGGLAYYYRNDLAVAIEKAMEDPRLTYVLGFYLSDKDRDRHFHTLRVEVNRPKAILRYRQGYTPVAQ